MIRRALPLAAGAARCPSTRTVHCAQADTCARALAPHEPGREVRDFSAEKRASDGSCVWRVAVQYAGQAAPQQRVHDAPEWLR